MPWQQQDPNLASYPQDPLADDPLRRWWLRRAQPWLSEFSKQGLFGERAAAMAQTNNPEPGLVGMGSYAPLRPTVGASGLSGLAGPLVSPAVSPPADIPYGPDPSYGPPRPQVVLPSQPPATQPQPSGLSSATSGLSALAPAIGSMFGSGPTYSSGTSPDMTRGGLGLSSYDSANPLSAPAGSRAPAYPQGTAGGDMPIWYPPADAQSAGNTTNPDSLQKLYDRIDALPAGRKPMTDEERDAQKSEDRRIAIATALLNFAQHAASGRGWQGIAEGVPAGGAAGLNAWTTSRRQADADAEKDAQQQFANELAKGTLVTQVEQARATRDQNAQLARDRMDLARMTAGETAADRRERIALERARMAQQGNQFDRSLAQTTAYQNAQIERGLADRTPAVLQTIAEMRRNNPGMTFNEAYDRVTTLGTKSDRDVLAGMYTKLASDPMNMGKSPAELADMARQALQALDTPGGPGGGGGNPYKGDAAPPIPGAKRLQDGTWAAPGPDGVLRRVYQ